MRKILIIIIIILSSKLYAQSKFIVVKIDTLNYSNSYETLSNFKLRVGNQGFLNLGDKFDTTAYISLKKYPNFKNKLVLDNKSSTIEIPIDFNGSYITIKNAYFLNADTLTINNWYIYDTKTLDSTVTFKSYYRIRKGKLVENPIKVKREMNVSKIKEPPTSVTININDIENEVKIKLNEIPEKLISNGHGYSRNKPYNKNSEYKKRLKYFHVYTIRKRYIWVGAIELMLKN
jgi:hypothetical protein